MNRLAIYLIYDKNNIVDRYIGYVVDQLAVCTGRIIVVVNGRKIAKGIEYLQSASEIIYRDNVGFDAGGFKECILDYLGCDEIKKYDELILLNDSFYGPFNCFEEIFNKMINKECDFWAASKHAETIYRGKLIKEHLQSFFIVIRRKMLHSEDFINYWLNMPEFKSFNDVIENYEMRFTEYFYNRGYTFECLADMQSNDSADNAEINFCQYIYLQYELIAKRNFPFLKKKPVSLNTLDMQTQENWKLAIDYIREHTEYDVDMIYENLIRLYDVSDLQKKLLLQYVISEKKAIKLLKNAVIVVNVRRPDSISYVKDYLERIKNNIDIIIYSNDEEVCNCLCEKNYKNYLGNIEDDKIISDIQKYEYVCFIDDCNIMNKERFSTIEKSYFYCIWENLVKSVSYIAGIVNLLNNDKWLGVLTAPAPLHADYFGKKYRHWIKNYRQIADIVKNREISCVMSNDKMPIVTSNNVWIRREVLISAIEHKVLKSKYINFLWSYIAQGVGLYSGVVENETYSCMNQINQQTYLDSMIAQMYRQDMTISTFNDLQKSITGIHIREFCDKYKKIYVYGTGAMADEYSSLIDNINGYIISDGQPKVKDKCVIYLSELNESNDIGIIVCLNEKNQAQVVPLLEERNFNYLCI